MKKRSSHFSVENIIRSEFRKPVSRAAIGKDINGLLWIYGVVLKDSLYRVASSRSTWRLLRYNG